MRPFPRDNFLPFSLPVIEDDDIQGVADVLKSGWITTGPKTAEFEKAFADFCGCPHACALTSATAGMHVLLKALNIGEGCEVITPSMTWVSTANLIALSGAKPVFADIDRSTLMITPETIAPVISEKTRLVIPVHFAGAPYDVDAISALLQERNILMIEDAAHAVGTYYKERKVGQSGTAIFSFHPIKNMTTGEGGMVCTDDGDLIDQVRRLKFHGLAKDAWQRYTKKGSVGPLEVLEPGFKYNFTDIQSALGLSQLKKLDRFNARRKDLALYYDELLKNVPEITPIGRPIYPHRHTHHLYIVLLDIDKVPVTRDIFLDLLKQYQIGTGVHFRAAHLQHYYREVCGYRRGLLPETEWVSDRLFSLPLFPSMTENDVNDVVQALQAAIVSARKEK
ncbi:MAG: UDP-4-amino-4-deoxy-L-arabinose aminotransferase [Candidatus Aureabacteria bacterium]|nr:UDP-4-amino-4-deoxy-L-arabinose aminotransferase [Candidatus Auribacterota bacterium]